MPFSTSRFVVTVSAGGLTSGGTSSGFIDPVTVNQYLSNTLRTGSSFGTIAVGQVVMINDYPVTIITGTTVANLATDINNLTHKHGAIAGTATGNLTLVNSVVGAMNRNFLPVSVADGTTGITAQIGFVVPTISVQALPTTLTQTLAKKRANWRWKFINEQIGLTMTQNKLVSVATSGATLWDTDPTSLTFTVVMDNSNPYGYDFNGNLVYGETAVRYAVAKALLKTQTVLDTIFDPTNNPVPIPNANSSMRVEIGALTTVGATALAAVTVTTAA